MRQAQHTAQVQLMRWASLMSNSTPELRMLSGHRNLVVAKELKAEGVRAGVPDLCLVYPKGRYHAMYVEMKSAKGRTSPAQNRWLDEKARRNLQWRCRLAGNVKYAVHKGRNILAVWWPDRLRSRIRYHSDEDGQKKRLMIELCLLDAGIRASVFDS